MHANNLLQYLTLQKDNISHEMIHFTQTQGLVSNFTCTILHKCYKNQKISFYVYKITSEKETQSLTAKNWKSSRLKLSLNCIAV